MKAMFKEWMPLLRCVVLDYNSLQVVNLFLFFRSVETFMDSFMI
jgi:hypothetical protein